MASLPQFRIEAVTVIQGRGTIVFAQYLGDGYFIIQVGFVLGGCKIQSAAMPRALNKDGSARLDLWGFQLQSGEDSAQLAEGEIVELSQ